MANYFLTIGASNACIAFIRKHPDSLEQFVAGTTPESPEEHLTISGRTKTLSVPADWPTEQAELGTDINHRNIDLYHWILNGTSDFVSGPGSIFQTWLTTRHAAIDLTGDNDSFAFEAEHLAPLAQLFSAVSKEAVAARFLQWHRHRGKTSNLSEHEIQAVWNDFCFVGQQVSECAQNGLGLIWILA